MPNFGEQNPLANHLLRALRPIIDRDIHKICVSGLQGSAKSFFLAALFRDCKRSLIVVMPTEQDGQALVQDLTFFLGDDQVFYYPAWDVHSMDLLAFQKEAALLRMEVLCRLLQKKPALYVTSIKALKQKVAPRSVLTAYGEIVSLGDMRDRDALAAKLLLGGYERVSLVEGKGEFSVRGNIVDIFTPAEDHPFRLEFVGDELESIRVFDPVTQRSSQEITEFSLVPAGEIIATPERKLSAVNMVKRRANELELPGLVKNRLTESLGNGLISSVNPHFLALYYSLPGSTDEKDGESLGSFFDYLPSDVLLISDDPSALSQADREADNEIDRLLFQARNEELFYLDREASYLSGEQLFTRCDRYPVVSLGVPAPVRQDEPCDPPVISVSFTTENSAFPREVLKAASASPSGPLDFLAQRIISDLEDNVMVMFLCHDQEEVQRMVQSLPDHGISPDRIVAGASFFTAFDSYLGVGKLVLLDGRLSRGFRLPDGNLTVITAEELFGRKIARRRTRPLREGYFLKSFGELNDGDYVVHRDHGIGIYHGLHKLVAGGLENDFLLLEYQEGDKLYIPVYRLDLLQRYVGPGDYRPPIDKLGGCSWDAVKERVKESVREVAEELASIYGARKIMEGHAYSVPRGIYDEFIAGFAYEETPDQAKAIEDVELDMNEAKPMDRLICGDAGFGKTEVALRASFIAAIEGKQVAILVPTTILAEQHYQTFSARLRDWPLSVEVINRFKTKAEQQKIIERVKAGGVDIVIGTHRLLQKDVEFKDLGLVVIDEEQRFGVAHKEKLKKLRTLVDVLTLTATPIPRTLHLAMVGIRDLTVINTPPEDRIPIKTYVTEFHEETIKEAIQKEMARAGRTFFLHDRIRSIYTMARLLEKLVPEATIGVVHGRMKPREIEDVMAGFIRGEYHVLVCTTIIGAGLDIPTANTIIVNRADRFGLAQLYQIKGRVGRAKEEGIAYFLIPKGMMLSRDARRRLQAIIDFSEHGSGFRISYEDLEMRGGGNILGTSQSGHISAVGYELYTEIMEQTLQEIKGEILPREAKPEIHLGVAAFIPEEYMSDVRRRLVYYKRLSMTEGDDELASIKAELEDCYGVLPTAVQNLCDVLSIKNILQDIKGKKMGYDKKNMVIAFHKECSIDPGNILLLAKERWPGIRLTPDLQLLVPMADLHEDKILREAKGLLVSLAKGGSES